MDSIQTITHAVTTVVTRSPLVPNMDSIGWILLFCGWLLYWLKVLNACRMAAGKGNPFASNFWQENMFEIPTSIVACLVLAILGNAIPSELLDMHGRISTLLIGYSSSSILNSIITMAKKQ